LYYCTVQSIGQRADSVVYVTALSIHIVTAGYCILQSGIAGNLHTLAMII
jgi:hypothetical protein